MVFNLKKLTVVNDIQDIEAYKEFGRKHGANFALFINNEFWHYYKKGNLQSKHCWLFMPLKNQKYLEWKNSFNLNLGTVVEFYKGRHYKVDLIPID